MSRVRIHRDLCRAVDRLRSAPPVACVRKPLAEARSLCAAYRSCWGRGTRQGSGSG